VRWLIRIPRTHRRILRVRRETISGEVSWQPGDSGAGTA
jgi:hypothetical protein